MLLKELFLKEDDRSTAVFAFGRFNPPTIGHEKLIETVLATAKTANAKPYLFLSHRQNNKTDPLSFNEKQEYIQALYPNLTVGDAGSNTIIKVLQKIQSEGRTKIIMVAGSDRVAEFSKLLNQYNGKPDKQAALPMQGREIQMQRVYQVLQHQRPENLPIKDKNRNLCRLSWVANLVKSCIT